jgi:hypothetical protein
LLPSLYRYYKINKLSVIFIHRDYEVVVEALLLHLPKSAMIPSATTVLQAFSTKPPGKEAYDLLPAFFLGPSTEIERFINAVLETLPNGGTFLDAALSHVSEDALDRLVDRWIPNVTSDGMTEAVEAGFLNCARTRTATMRTGHGVMRRYPHLNT